ncbi:MULTISPECIES: pyridoxal phosphate-dependent decarboxylase family protein [unclassified Streptomyces]|uniref:pyridoxal phosphate-dependent decarboxylase family protein n=1 Tax=unclassified Streptomyces TaxID=2593676 RepID=UPI00296678F9|nr:pyridoxal-dependent decarboxylase [Streptomyces sp. SJL17-1]
MTERIAGELVRDYLRWRRSSGGAPVHTDAEARGLLRTLSRRMAERSTPWPAPGYLAHMTGDTPVAVTLAYLCALLYNPNNIAPETSPVTTELEYEVADDLCRLVGHAPGTGWAHLCSGAHAAGYEALWIARNLTALAPAAARHPAGRDVLADVSPARLANLPVPFLLDLVERLAARDALDEVRRLRAPVGDAALLVGRTAHYAWTKAADLLGFAEDRVEPVGVDRNHRMDLADLRARVERLIVAGRPIAAVVCTVGTTTEGAVDDLAGVLQLRTACERRFGAGFPIHVDAAYGGYFRTVLDVEDTDAPTLKPEVASALRALPYADSVTVDPHKCGQAPYPAGALVVRDRRALAVVAARDGCFGEPRPDGGLPFAPYTLEGARPGAAAAAVWAAHRLGGLHTGGYGTLLAGCLDTARHLHEAFTVPLGTVAPGPTSPYAPDLAVLNLTPGAPGDARAWSARLRESGLWVSTTRAGGIRLCVMKPLDTRGRRHVEQSLRLT